MSQWNHLVSVLDRQSRDALQTAVDLVIPPMCALCRSDLGKENRWLGLCGDCCDLITRSSDSFCARCGQQSLPCERGSEGIRRPRCACCVETQFAFSDIFTIGPYQNHLRHAVLQTKHPQGYPLAVALGRLLADTHKTSIEQFQPDRIIATPMHWLRRLQRGINGPDAIASSMAKYLGLPRAKRDITRSRDTARQVYLSQDRRLKNLKGAFRLHRKNVSGKRILLIDDVMTTGATCNEVARLLRRHGAKSVAVAVIARQGLNTPRKIA